MDRHLREILDSLPSKPPRSRLEPYHQLITELRQRGRTYRDIAEILTGKCHVEVTASGVHDFLRTRSKRTRTRGESLKEIASRKSTGASAVPRTPTSDAIAKDSTRNTAALYIKALKARKIESKSVTEDFHFDASEPLRLKKLDKDMQHE